MNINSPPDSLHRYIRPRWKQRHIRTYAFISRLKSDTAFRDEWIKRRLQKEGPAKKGSFDRLLREFTRKISLVPVVNTAGKPVIRTLPRRYRGYSCKFLLDIETKHLATCISQTVDEAARSIIHGYGIVQTLGAVFGTEYRDMVNRYIIKKMNEEIRKHGP